MAQTPEEKAAAKAAKEQAAAEAKAAKEAEKAAAKAAPAATEATVSWNGGSRVYSQEIHGDNFAALAKQFADQYPEAVIS